MSDEIFLSTLSLRRATTRQTYQQDDEQVFLSTLSLRRATDTELPDRYRNWISIHALLAESDFPPLLLRSIHEISIHALLAESDGIVPVILAPRA